MRFIIFFEINYFKELLRNFEDFLRIEYEEGLKFQSINVVEEKTTNQQKENEFTLGEEIESKDQQEEIEPKIEIELTSDFKVDNLTLEEEIEPKVNDTIIEEIEIESKENGKFTNIVDKTFKSIMKSTIICHHCKNVKQKTEI